MPTKPQAGEDQSTFMGRCVPTYLDEGMEQDQAVAACMSMWRAGPDKEGSSSNKPPPGKPPFVKSKQSPDEGESRSEFMQRCVADLEANGMDPEDAEQQCELSWDDYGAVEPPANVYRASKAKRMVRKLHAEHVQGMDYVLSDASQDRFGDMIKSEGWVLDNFKRNPIALFNHDKGFIIGKWENLRVIDGRLRSRLRLAPEGTSPRIDEIRRLVEADILRATSVGFLPIAVQQKNKAARGDVYLQQELVEASLVSVPANPNALAVAKSLKVSDDTLKLVFAKHGDKGLRRTVVGSAGEHAKNQTMKRKFLAMSPLATRIQDTQTRIVKLKEQLETHLKSVDDENPDEASTATTDELSARIDAQEKSLDALKRAESKIFVQTADTGTGTGTGTTGTGTGGNPATTGNAIIVPRSFAEAAKKLSPADHIIRSLVVAVKRHADNNRAAPEFYLAQTYGENKYSEQTRVVMDVVTRAAVAPATTTTVGWAAELVQTVVADFMETLVPASIYPGLSAKGLRLTFGRNGQITVPSRNRGTAISGSFVGEGAPIPVRKGLFQSVPLVPKKMGVISTFTRQIAEHSTPAIEGLIRSAIQEDTAVAIDVVLLDSNTSTAVRPAGLLNGVTALTPTAGGGFTALVGDIKALTAALISSTVGHLRNPVWLMNPVQQLAISLTANTAGDFPFKAEINNNTFQGYPVIVSPTVPAGTVIFMDAADFVSVTGDEPKFDVSDQAVLHEEDTTPLALGTVGTPASIAAPARSLWQTDTIGIRMLLDINWALRRTGVVAYTTGVTW